MRVALTARRLLHSLGREMFPTPEAEALRRIEALSKGEARYTSGRTTLMDLDLEYSDIESVAPQWNDLFVRHTLEMTFTTASPRVLDCGANIGLVSLWLKRRYPAARITAFEADEQIATILRRNLARNGAGDVEVVQAAVWKEDGTLAFRREGSDSGAVEAVAADTPGTVTQVPAVSLRPWIEREPIDLLKLDIEGAELDVLEDLAPVLGGVGAIHVEIHDFEPSRRLLPSCLLLLEQAGFTYALDDLVRAHWRPNAKHDGPFGVDVLPSWIVLVRAWKDGTT